MDPKRARWNEQHKALRQALKQPQEHARAVALFLDLHAQVHAAATGAGGLWSFADGVWKGLSDRAARCVPPGGEQSIAWITWHMARIEDVTMNLLAANGVQVLTGEGWAARLNIERIDTGNLMHGADIAALSAKVDLIALLAYRAAVGDRTRAIVPTLSPDELRARVRPERLQGAVDEGAVLPELTDLLAYWGGLSVAGLLLMPPTRHNFVHLNEALRIKRKVTRL